MKSITKHTFGEEYNSMPTNDEEVESFNRRVVIEVTGKGVFNPATYEEEKTINEI